MRRVRGVGLALVDPRGIRVGAVLDVVGCSEHAVRAGLVLGAAQHHEVRPAARNIERIVGSEWHHHHALRFPRGIDTVIEELSEQGEHAVVGRGQTEVRGDVRDVERLPFLHTVDRDAGAFAGYRGRFVVDGPVCTAGGRDGRRVVGRLVHDHVADEARGPIGDVGVDRPIGLSVRSGAPLWFRKTGKRKIRGPELFLALDEVVVRAVHGTESVWHQGVCYLVGTRTDQRCSRHRIALGVLLGGVVLGDLDLLQDEAHVPCVESQPLADRSS